MKERYKNNVNGYVLLIVVKLYTKRFSRLLIQREIAVKVTKRKTLIGRVCGATFLPRPRKSKGRLV